MMPTAASSPAWALQFRAVEADSGPIGGSFSHEFMVLADTGEDLIVSCTACGYGANTEKAEIRRPADQRGARSEQAEALQKVETPGMRTVEEVTGFLKVPPQRLIKTLIFTGPEGPIAALVRGDHEINEVKLRNALGYDHIELADEAAIEEADPRAAGICRAHRPEGHHDCRLRAHGREQFRDRRQ